MLRCEDYDIKNIPAFQSNLNKRISGIYVLNIYPIICCSEKRISTIERQFIHLQIVEPDLLKCMVWGRRRIIVVTRKKGDQEGQQYQPVEICFHRCTIVKIFKKSCAMQVKGQAGYQGSVACLERFLAVL